jgi:hypothetical protein
MKKFLFWLVLIIIIGLASFIYMRYYFTYSEGNRAGLLQKVSYKGNLFKTYEGELVLSSVESSRDVALASEKFQFSVTDKNTAEKLTGLQGHFVVVHYTQKHGKLPWRGDSEYFVDSVREGR